MRIAIDTETHLIKPGMLAPKLVCVSWAAQAGEVLLDAKEGIRFVRKLLEGHDLIIGHNIAYDFGVLAAEDPGLLPLIFKAYADGRIADTKVRQMLIDIAQGTLKYRPNPDGEGDVPAGNSLADCVKLWLGRELPKNGTWRLSYAKLDGVPIIDWPEEAVRYATDDAKATLAVYEAQAAKFGEITNEADQVRAAWALHLMSVWGVRTDAAAVAQLEKELTAEQAAVRASLAPSGIFRKNGTKDLKVIRERVKTALADPPLTETGEVSTAAETLESTGDPHLRELSLSLKGAKVLSTYMAPLKRASEAPLCANYNVLLETGRTSCSKPNMQNPPRAGMVRTCFVPRAGHLFCAVDYDTLELRALAQVCLSTPEVGYSRMAEAVRAGEDLHLNLAAELLGLDKATAIERYKAGDKEVEEARQLAKAANFGFPGGLGPATFIEYARGNYRLNIDLATAQRLRENWFRAWPEMQNYFQYIAGIVGSLGEGVVQQLRSGRVRGGVTFTKCANGFFQGLAADGAKQALWDVAREAYLDTSSPLYGTRPVIFMHDEIVAEVPEEGASEAAGRLAEVMRLAMSKWIPDVPITCSPVLMRRWFKGAKPVRVDGKLVPVRPEKRDGKTVWIADLDEERKAA